MWIGFYLIDFKLQKLDIQKWIKDSIECTYIIIFTSIVAGLVYCIIDYKDYD
jgi:hypothetical protein